MQFTFEYMNTRVFNDRQTSTQRFNTIEEAAKEAADYCAICFNNDHYVWVRVIESPDL
jgi:hypothetical protein